MPPVKPTRIVGLDYGLARIGIAISDELKIIASPGKTISGSKKLEYAAKNIVSEIESLKQEKSCDIEKIVIGMPLRMNGQVGVQADEVKALAQILESLIDIPIVLWDERLTTVQAERSLREGKMSRKKRSKVVDSVAAIIILQSYLDQI
ncbi:MAG: putative pre-16S rRNA nuclease [Chlamydiae bacterium]|nr:putative pre-16S rRNA nuclease [Chlamydiota bacterium]